MPQRRKYVVHFAHRAGHFGMFMRTVLVVTVFAFSVMWRSPATSNQK
jgi:hypothetical protein